MFGGRLCSRSFHFTPQNEFVVAFGNRIYLYDETARCLDVLYEAKEPIVAFCNTQGNFVCIDSGGNIVQFNEDHEVLYQAVIKAKVDSAVMSEYGVYVASRNRLVFQAFNKKPKEKVLYECKAGIHLLSISGVYLLVGEASNLHIIDTHKPTEIKTVSHVRKVTSAWVDNENLVIGDEKGVITNYLSEFGEKQGQTVIEHWHVHSVKALYGTPFAMISGGEEGVAVLWHRTASKKDFLPRFGAEIVGISSNEQSTLLAFSLTDNTVRVVDTNNNNQVVTIRQVIDPRGTKIQRMVDNPTAKAFQVGIHFNPQNLLLCTNSTPGKLQFIDINNNYFTEDSAAGLEVVPRNWVSRLDDDYPCPAQLSHVCFNDSWSKLLVVSETAYQTKLHFYEYQESWKLVCKVDSAQRVVSVGNYTCAETQRTRFLTASGTSIRIWREYAPKQKAESYYKERKFWDCEGEFKYREMAPLSLHCTRVQKEDIMTVSYADYVVCVVPMQLNQNLNLRTVTRQLKVPNVQEAILTGSGLILRTESTIQLFGGEPARNLLNIKGDRVLSFRLNGAGDMVAVHLQEKGHSILAVLDLSQLQIADCFKLSKPIEGYFWAVNNLLFLNNDLQLVEVIRVTQIFKQSFQTLESQDSAKQTTDSSVAPETSFAEHYRKELRKQLATQQKSKLTRQIFEEATVIPSFTVSFGLLAGELLM